MFNKSSLPYLTKQLHVTRAQKKFLYIILKEVIVQFTENSQGTCGHDIHVYIRLRIYR